MDGLPPEAPRPALRQEEWYEFSGDARGQVLLDGGVSVDEVELADGQRGMSLRLRDPETDEWTIFWVNSRDGALQAPVRGHWKDGVFEAHGVDEYEGRPIRARYLWSRLTPTSAQWEQAFSQDDGASWETNWVMTWARTLGSS